MRCVAPRASFATLHDNMAPSTSTAKGVAPLAGATGPPATGVPALTAAERSRQMRSPTDLGLYCEAKVSPADMGDSARPVRAIVLRIRRRAWKVKGDERVVIVPPPHMRYHSLTHDARVRFLKRRDAPRGATKGKRALKTVGGAGTPGATLSQMEGTMSPMERLAPMIVEDTELEQYEQDGTRVLDGLPGATNGGPGGSGADEDAGGRMAAGFVSVGGQCGLSRGVTKALDIVPVNNVHHGSYYASIPYSPHISPVLLPWEPDDLEPGWSVEVEWFFFVSYADHNDRRSEWVPWSRIAGTERKFKKRGQKSRGGFFDMVYRILSDGTEELFEEGLSPDIDEIVIGSYMVHPWYWSNIGHETLMELENNRLYVCEFCLAYKGSRFQYERHLRKCTARSPPGTEIYRALHDEEKGEGLAFFQVDANVHNSFCCNLGRFTKFFLLHKGDWDLRGFWFFVLTKYSSRGYQIVGYFSKSKIDDGHQRNLSCILAMPQYQGKGYGRLLMEFSYELSKIQGLRGGPERPMSDMGVITYRNFWRDQVCELVYRFLLYKRDAKKLGDEKSYRKWMGEARRGYGRGTVGEFGGVRRGQELPAWEDGSNDFLSPFSVHHSASKQSAANLDEDFGVTLDWLCDALSFRHEDVLETLDAFECVHITDDRKQHLILKAEFMKKAIIRTKRLRIRPEKIKDVQTSSNLEVVEHH